MMMEMDAELMHEQRQYQLQLLEHEQLRQQQQLMQQQHQQRQQLMQQHQTRTAAAAAAAGCRSPAGNAAVPLPNEVLRRTHTAPPMSAQLLGELSMNFPMRDQAGVQDFLLPDDNAHEVTPRSAAALMMPSHGQMLHGSQDHVQQQIDRLQQLQQQQLADMTEAEYFSPQLAARQGLRVETGPASNMTSPTAAAAAAGAAKPAGAGMAAAAAGAGSLVVDCFNFSDDEDEDDESSTSDDQEIIDASMKSGLGSRGGGGAAALAGPPSADAAAASAAASAAAGVLAQAADGMLGGRGLVEWVEAELHGPRFEGSAGSSLASLMQQNSALGFGGLGRSISDGAALQKYSSAAAAPGAGAAQTRQIGSPASAPAAAAAAGGFSASLRVHTAAAPAFARDLLLSQQQGADISTSPQAAAAADAAQGATANAHAAGSYVADGSEFGLGAGPVGVLPAVVRWRRVNTHDGTLQASAVAAGNDQQTAAAVAMDMVNGGAAAATEVAGAAGAARTISAAANDMMAAAAAAEASTEDDAGAGAAAAAAVPGNAAPLPAGAGAGVFRLDSHEANNADAAMAEQQQQQSTPSQKHLPAAPAVAATAAEASAASDAAVTLDEAAPAAAGADEVAEDGTAEGPSKKKQRVGAAPVNMAAVARGLRTAAATVLGEKL
jgi:hypothetical protein